MTMIDPFIGSAFTLTSLTMAINKLPNRYGRLEQLGLFPISGISTRTLEIESKDGILTLVPTVPWGAPANQNKSGKRKIRNFSIPHTPLEDAVMAVDVQGVRLFGSESQAETVQSRVNDKLQEMRDKLDQTLEFRRFGALKGIVYDADGTTVLYNYFNEFGVTQKAVDFTLGTSTTDILGTCMTVKRWIEDNALGENYGTMRVLCSRTFYDKFVAHANVKAVFQNWQAAEQRMGSDMRGGFPFGGLIFEEYSANTTGSDGNNKKYIADGDAWLVLEGTSSTYKTFAAPADFMETVNTIGMQYYAKSNPLKYNRGLELHIQTNVLPILTRPELSVRLYTSN